MSTQVRTLAAMTLNLGIKLKRPRQVWANTGYSYMAKNLTNNRDRLKNEKRLAYACAGIFSEALAEQTGNRRGEGTCGTWPHRLSVRSPPFQGGETGSIPVVARLTIFATFTWCKLFSLIAKNF